MADTDASSSPPLAKYLASTGSFLAHALVDSILTVCIDKKTRDKAIKNLSIFLSVSGEDALPKNEMAKLWKGIFYCTCFISLHTRFHASF